jgi:hypothetical protein
VTNLTSGGYSIAAYEQDWVRSRTIGLLPLRACRFNGITPSLFSLLLLFPEGLHAKVDDDCLFILLSTAVHEDEDDGFEFCDK